MLTLAALALELDQTYRALAARLPENTAIRFETVDGKAALILSTLDKLDESASLKALRKTVKERPGKNSCKSEPLHQNAIKSITFTNAHFLCD